MFERLIAFVTARVQAATESQVTGRMAELKAAIDQAVAAGVAAAMAKIEARPTQTPKAKGAAQRLAKGQRRQAGKTTSHPRKRVLEALVASNGHSSGME